MIRTTSANSTDALVGRLTPRVSRVEYAHWHSTEIEKGLPPEEIVMKYATLNKKLFRTLVYREDIAKLKTAIGLRSALQQYHGDAMRRFRQAARSAGAANLDDVENEPVFADALESLAEIRGGIKAEDGVSFDTHVKKLAAKVPEVKLFNSISGMKDVVIASTIVCALGDIQRFVKEDGQAVHSVWHYSGMHVVDGRMPKRKKGAVMDWNPGVRTAAYMLGQCIIKNRNNPWRDVFDRERAREIGLHDEKHPGCKSRDGHCTAMAARKVSKEIIKRFVLAATETPYVEGHKPF